MVLQKIRQMLPSAVTEQDYEEKMRRAFQDKEACVMGTALNLYYDEIKRGNGQKYKGMASNFVATLKQIIEHKLHKVGEGLARSFRTSTTTGSRRRGCR